MASVLVATGFVRIDSDTKPALKALKALGAIGGQALSTALLPATAAVVAGIAAVTGSALAAGAAFGAFAAAVKPQFSEITEASSQYTTAQKAQEKADLNVAQAKSIAAKFGIKYGDTLKITEKMSASTRAEAEKYNKALGEAKSSMAAAGDAQTLYKQKLAAMQPATRTTALALMKLKDDFKKWSDSLAGTTMPIFTRGIEGMGRALPKLTPFVKMASIQIKSFLDTLGEGSAGVIFRQFGQNMQRNAGGAIKNFLTFGKNMVAGILGILNAFAPMQSKVTGGMGKMSEGFAAWSANLGSSQGFQTFIRTAQEGGPRVGEALKAIGHAFKEISSAAGPLAGVGLKVLTLFAQLVDAIPTQALRMLVPAIIAVNLALKLYAIGQAVAAAVTWLFTTSVTTSTGAVFASRIALLAHRLAMIAFTAACVLIRIAMALWTVVTVAGTLALRLMRGVLLALRFTLIGLRIAVLATATAFRIMAVALVSNPIALIILGIAALVAAIVWVATKTTWFQTAWKFVWGGIQTAFRAVMGFLTSGLARFALLLLGPLGALILLAANFKKVWGAIQAVAGAVGRWFSGPFVNFFKGAWDFIYKWFIQPWVLLFTVALPAAAAVAKARVVGFIGGLRDGLMAIYNWIYGRFIRPWVVLFTILLPAAASVAKARVVSFMGNLRDGLMTIYNWIYGRFIKPWVVLFTVVLPSAASTAKYRVLGFLSNLRDGMRTIVEWIQNRIFRPFGNFFTKTIPGWAQTMKDKVKSFFTNMRDGIGTIWSGIQAKTKSPINWVITHVWNNGIVGMWKKITGWIGLGNKLGKIKLLAAGGVVGKARPGMFNRPTAIVGEGNPRYPEYVIPTDPKHATRARNLWQAAGAHFMEDGGIIGSIGSGLKSAAGSVKGAVGSITDFLSNPLEKAKKLLQGPLNKMRGLGSSDWVQMATKFPKMAVDGLLGLVKKAASGLFGNIAGAIGLGGGGGSGVQRWSGVVQAALRQVGQPAAYTGITLRRMNQESGGNPTVVNKWDSNWKAGYPSVGLMQVIRPTFQSNAGPYAKTGPFLYGVSVNPLANVYASMRYALRAYGSLPRAYNRAGGYANGTAGTAGGMHLFGEQGPEMGFSPSGWRILNARRTAGLAGAGGAGGAGVTELHLHLDNHGVLGSRAEVMDWLIKSLDDLRRQGRLTTIVKAAGA